MAMAFRNRTEAGRKLAEHLESRLPAGERLVLALPRGGVPVARPIADRLQAPLDVLVVRKLGVPGQEELAMGALGPGGIRLLNDEIVRTYRISEEEIAAAAEREARELKRRERAYRGGRPPLPVHNRTVILVDDGMATGASMRAAVEALQKMGAPRIIVAVPVAAEDAIHRVAAVADLVVCLLAPRDFGAVGQFYSEFAPVEDAEVRALLERTASPGGTDSP